MGLLLSWLKFILPAKADAFLPFIASHRSGYSPALMVCEPSIFVRLALQLKVFSTPCSGNREAYEGFAALLTPKVAAGTRLYWLTDGKSCGIVKPTVWRSLATRSDCDSGGPASLNCEYPMLPWKTSVGEKMWVRLMTPDGVMAV